MDFLVYTPTVTPRIRYIFNHILSNMLGFRVIFTQQLNELNNFDGPKLSYSHNKTNNCINITPHNLLFENKINKQSFVVSNWESLPILFDNPSNETIPFDIFAASFLLISRYEEYITEGTDIHERFKVQNSLAHQHGFLGIPLVDVWVNQLGNAIENKFPNITVTKRKFEFIPTIDIDNAFAYKHKGIGHNTLAFVNTIVNGRFSDSATRLKYFMGTIRDPYDNYNQLFKTLDKNRNAVWFILGGSKSKFDRNIPITKKAMLLLLQRIANQYEIGLHPSYASNISATKVANEILTLSICSNQKITKSRQHFLKLSLPETYRTLVEMGIREDYTMGYSNAIGFRASTCTPFNFYDLKNEKELPLRVVPFQVIDRAMLDGLNMNAESAIAETLNIARRVKEVGGCFVTIWHNESLSGINEWGGWEFVLERIVSGVNEIENY